MLGMIDCGGKLLDLEIFLNKKKKCDENSRDAIFMSIFSLPNKEQRIFPPVTMEKMRKDQTCQKQTQ